MKPFIIERGKKIVHDETLIKSPIAYTEHLILFKTEIDKLVRESFLD